jgi:hypothetical protein
MRVFLELRPGSEPSFCNPDQRWPVRYSWTLPRVDLGSKGFAKLVTKNEYDVFG